MTEKNQTNNDIFNTEKPLCTLIALDTGFSCLIENIKNTHPELAQSLAKDLQQTAQRIPLHLPPQAHAVADVLEKWANVLNSNPIPPTHHQSN